MVRSFFAAVVALALAAGAAWGYAPPERGSRTSKPSDALPAEGSTLETAQTEAARIEAPRTEEPPTTAPPAKSSRGRAARDARKERAAVPARAVEEPAPPAQELPAPATAPPAAEPQRTAPAEISPRVEPTAAAMPDMVPDFPVMRTLGGIGIVLSLMIGGFFAARRFAPQLIQKPPSQKSLKVLETLQMGDKRSITIVQVGERRLLLGNTSSRITLLASLEPSPETETAGVSVEMTPKRAQAAAGSFRNIFEVEKRPAPPRGAGAPKTISPDVRAKMRQLRESLEQ